MSAQLTHSYSIFIAATPEQIWDALTKPEFTLRYFPNTAAHSDWRTGSDYAHTTADGATVVFDGKVLESSPHRRLVQTVNFKLDATVIGHQEMTISWDIEQVGDACLLTIVHKGFDSDAALFGRLTSHCPHTLSGMKTLLETGKPLNIADPASTPTN